MKIAIIGYSGSGKSTLARELSSRLSIPVLHLDRIGWSSGWVLRDQNEASRMISHFLDTNNNWIIDGNWGQFDKGRRYDEADTIVFMNFPRFRCLFRAMKRRLQYQGKTRPDLAEECPEKFDIEFAWWILAEGRNAERVQKYNRVAEKNPGKIIELRSPGDVKSFLKGFEALQPTAKDLR